MNAIDAYLDIVADTLEKARSTQHAALDAAARLIADATVGKRSVFLFGCSHAGLLALEMYYRTGGLATMNPVRAPGLHLDIDPATMTSQMERLPGYGRVIVDALPIKSGDVMVIHSVSGRNPVPIDVAIRCREKGVRVIVLTNMRMTASQSSRHEGGKHLYEYGDIVIDNCGENGDAALPVPGVAQKVGPTSTAVGAALLNAVMVQAVCYIRQAGVEPPVFMSANLDGGDEHNRRVLSEYKDHIFYMGQG